MVGSTNKKIASASLLGGWDAEAIGSGNNVPNVIPSNHHTTPNNKVNQDSDWLRKRNKTIELLRNIQVGNPPNGITSENCIHPDGVAEILQAYDASGIVAALKLLEATPDLYHLVCEEEASAPKDEVALQVRSVPKIGVEVDLRNHSVGRLLLVAAACFLLSTAIARWFKLTVSFKSTYQTGG